MHCNVCGKKIEDTSKRCSYCGTIQIPDEEHKPLPDDTKKNNGWIRIAGAAVVFILGVGIVLFFFPFGKGKSPEEPEITVATQDTTSPEAVKDTKKSAVIDIPGITEDINEKNLFVQIGFTPDTLDPAVYRSISEANLIFHLFDSLLSLDEDGVLQPGQAESWDISDDGLIYTFTLRKDLKWSDSSPLTAEDFVYSWKRIADPELSAPYADLVLGMIKGFASAAAGDHEALAVYAPDEHTFVVELSEPVPYFLSLAALPILSPVRQEAVQEYGESWSVNPDTYICNGAFYITQWDPGYQIEMTKNPHYRDADAVKLDKLTFFLIDDKNEVFSAFQEDLLDMIKVIPTEEIAGLQGNPEYYADPVMGIYYLSLKSDTGPLSDPLVRKALSLAIDREYLAGTVMHGTYAPAGNLIGPGIKDADGSDFMDNANDGIPFFDPSRHDSNLKEAKALLKEAGYPDGKGIPPLRYVSMSADLPVAEYLETAWEELGITVALEFADISGSLSEGNGDMDMILRNGWICDYNDPGSLLEIFYSTGKLNYGKYENPEYDALLDLSRSSANPDERYAAFHEAEKILMEDVGMIPVAYFTDCYLVKDNVTGWWHSSYGYWCFKYADIS